MDDRLDERGGQSQTSGLRNRAAGRAHIAPRFVRRGEHRLSALRITTDRKSLRIRLDRMQGAVALHDLPRAFRLFQVHLSHGMAHGFHPLTIADVRLETPEAISIRFAVPEEMREDFTFTSGQYLTLRTELDGREVRRSYSICSGMDEGELRVAVKRLDGGLFS